MSLKVYGHFVSQPTRSLVWLLKLKELPFDFIKVEPVAGDTKAPEYTAKFPTQLIPAVQDDDFCMTDSSAIMIYLCEKHRWSDWYPTDDLRRKARVHEYLGNHSDGTRAMTRKVFFPALKQTIVERKALDGEDIAKQDMSEIGERFQSRFLKRSDYIAGDSPTIADLLAYCELAQVPQALGYQYENLPELESWLESMSQLPHHDDVHKSLFKLGNMIQIISTKSHL